MKKIFISLIAICLLFSLLPLSACALEIYEQSLADQSYAVILDSDGNIVKELDLEISVEQLTESRSGGATYSITYTARDLTKSDPDSSTKDGVTAVGTITWYDAFGPNNTLISVEGNWYPSNRTLSERTIKYGARDFSLQEIDTPFQLSWSSNSFEIPQSNVFGYQFYLQTTAKINETNHYIAINAVSSVDAT